MADEDPHGLECRLCRLVYPPAIGEAFVGMTSLAERYAGLLAEVSFDSVAVARAESRTVSESRRS
jgi:hypothetical protein